VSYQTQAQLEQDPNFQARSRSAAVQQAAQFNDHLSDMIRRDDPGPAATFIRMNAAGPGISEKVDVGDGTIDQTQVTDEDLLSLTQVNWPIILALYPETT
jgi:hypothetical protein